MSRCFPFPPPGYENKTKPDDSSFIIKEKHKHKKHKNKDKDKKERSERKDKERSKGNHKEDKDRKQKKHGDKKDKKKEKRKSSEEEKKIAGPSEDQNGGKPGPGNKPIGGAHGRLFLAELGRRVRNDDDKPKSSEENKIVRSSENQNGEVLGPDSKPDDGARNCKFFVETGKRARNDDGSTDIKDKKKQKSSEEKKIVGTLGNQNGEKPGLDNRPGNGAHDYRILVEMGKRVRNDDGAKDNIRVSTANGQNLGAEAKCSGNNHVGNFSDENRIKVGNGSYQANVAEKRNGGKGKSGDRLENENRGKRRKDDEERKKEEKMEVNERRKEPDDLLKESRDGQGTHPELKGPVPNGFLRENGTRADNISRPAISSHRVGQNGNASHPSQKNTIPLTMEKQDVFTNQKVNGKLLSSQPVVRNVQYTELARTANDSAPGLSRALLNNHAVSNGFISSHPIVEDGREMAVPNNTDKIVEGQRPGSGTNSLLEGKKDISPRPSSASIKPPKEKAGAFIKKAPHPDSKYLGQILTVPKLDPPRFDDDQDWLSGCNDAKRPSLGPSEVECTDRVWAKAIRLEGADVTVLPYVVPY